jgi:hypothetical protein
LVAACCLFQHGAQKHFSSHSLAQRYIHILNTHKGLPQQAEVAQGVLDRLRPRIFLTFGAIRVVGRQAYAPAAFTPEEIPGTHFQRLSRPQGTWFRREPRKKYPVTPPGIDPVTSRLVAQCLNHYATPDPRINVNRYISIVVKTVIVVFCVTTLYNTVGAKRFEGNAVPFIAV